MSVLSLPIKNSAFFDFTQNFASDNRLVKKSGEFELPELDEYEIHKPLPAAKKSAKSNSEDNNNAYYKEKAFTYFKRVLDTANGFNIFTSGAAALISALTKNTNTIEMTKKLASVGAKISMGVNSCFNIYNGHMQKDLSIVSGYAGEFADAFFAPYNIMGLIRGLTFTIYQIPNILTSLGPMPACKNYGENFNLLKERIPLLLKKLFDMSTYKNLTKNLELITGGWGALCSGAGVLTWFLTGNTKLGSMIKGVGEMLVDAFQVMPLHWLEKRYLYIMSGLSFMMGSLCEIISKQRNNDPTTMALYFFGSGVGRMLFTWSNILGERTEDSNRANLAAA